MIPVQENQNEDYQNEDHQNEVQELQKLAEQLQPPPKKVDGRSASSKLNVQKAIEARKRKAEEQKRLREEYEKMFNAGDDIESEDSDDSVYELVNTKAQKGKGKGKVEPEKEVTPIMEYAANQKAKKAVQKDETQKKLEKIENMMFLMMQQINQPRKRNFSKVVKVNQGPTKDDLKAVVKDSVESVKNVAPTIILQQPPMNMGYQNPVKDQLKESILKFN